MIREPAVLIDLVEDCPPPSSLRGAPGLNVEIHARSLVNASCVVKIDALLDNSR